MSLYEYHALDPIKREIRLIHLQPRRESNGADGLSQEISDFSPSTVATIRCTIDHVSLDDDPHYEALSYAWGNAKDVYPIELHAKHIFITANLAHALFEFQKHISQPRALWIDALCINQNDDSEKSDQVQKMGEIFRNAAGVVVWLGPKDDTSTAAIAAIKRLTHANLWAAFRTHLKEKRSKTTNTRTLEDEAVLLEEEANLVTKIGSCLDSDGSGTELRGLRRLIGRPWFERVWVLQEVAVSKDALVTCGPDAVTWKSLDRAHRLISFLRRRKLDHKMESELKYIENRLWLLCNVWFDLHHFQKKRSLWYLLGNVSKMKASDPRDLVYALLGLAADTGHFKIDIDYSKTVNEVFIELAIKLLNGHGLEPLSHCLLTPTERQEFLRPSWVPDWTSSIEMGLTLGVLRKISQPESSESTQTYSPGILEMSLHLSANILSLPGYLLDTINCISEALPCRLFETMDSKEKVLIISKWLKDFHLLLNSAIPAQELYLTPEKLIPALWRTPIADCIFGNNWKLRPAQPEDDYSYRVLIGREDPPDNYNDARLHRYIYSIIHIAQGRRMFISSRGYIGLGPFSITVGDTICVFREGNTPFILSEAEIDRFQLVGEAYVHGLEKESVLTTDLPIRAFHLI